MWYEAIPPMIIITVGLWIPHIATKGLHTLMFDNPFRRDMTLCYHRTMFVRDGELTGAPWKIAGLDNIPDEPKKP